MMSHSMSHSNTHGCLQTGIGAGRDNEMPGPASANQKAPAVPRKRVDMVDSYLNSVTSSNVTSCVDAHNFNISTRNVSLTGSSKGQVLSLQGAHEESGTTFGSSGLHNVLPSGDTENTDTSTTAIPGLSIITWEEFIEEPSLLHDLFTKDKSEFIQFDANVVTNLFHDSRMDPPLLGGPSGDGLSWTIFVDSYAQLKEVREVLTTRISVLLVDLVKPNNEGTASCLVAINPFDDQIRRVLHLTMSRAMETMFADRSFSVEIDLNENVRQWCQAVLQIECQVNGGRVVVTNGDPVEGFCLVDNPAFCVLAFPVWLYRRIRYITHRKRHYDDTLVEFEGANFVLCTRSESLRQYSEAVQLSSGDRLIQRNTCAVTTATQTLNSSTTSLKSELSLQEIDDASDNDVMKRRESTSDTEALRTAQCHTNPSFDPMDEERDMLGVENAGMKSNAEILLGKVNDSYIMTEEKELRDPISRGKHDDKYVTKKDIGKVKSVHFAAEDETKILSTVAMANMAKSVGLESKKEVKQIMKEPRPEESMEGDIPSPRSDFHLRPDTPFRPTPKERKSKGNSAAVEPVTTTTPSKTNNSTSTSGGDINDKIVKRQKKISNLLKDLVSFNSPTYKPPGDPSPNDDLRGTENEHEIKLHSPRYEKNNFFSSPIETPAKPQRKAGQTPVRRLSNSDKSSVFPYTSDLLNFPAMSSGDDVYNLEKYGARLKKNDKGKKKAPRRTEDMLFMPRLNLEDIDPDRNCFSDQDIADSDVTDLEAEPEGAMSDTEGILSSRLIPVYSTERTLSIDSVNNCTNAKVSLNTKKELDSDLEITDCEVDDQMSPRSTNSPRILPGAKAAHQLRSSSAHARSRDYIPPTVLVNRRGGNQNDSRRRYLALNSLRRKAYKLALQSQVRSQKRPSSAELLSYNQNSRPSSASNIAIMSKV